MPASRPLVMSTCRAIEESVLDAVNSRTRQILAGWRGPVISGAKPIVPKARQRRVIGETQGGLSQLD